MTIISSFIFFGFYELTPIYLSSYLVLLFVLESLFLILLLSRLDVSTGNDEIILHTD